jgi:hypothetical protein
VIRESFFRGSKSLSLARSNNKIKISFISCESVKSVVFEENSQLSRLEAEAFRGSGLTSIHLPASVTVIGASCFSNCGSLASITFESGSRLSQLEERAFLFSRLKWIHLPASVTVISKDCFSRCHSLASITFDPASPFRGKAADLLAGVPLGETDLRVATALLDDEA